MVSNMSVIKKKQLNGATPADNQRSKLPRTFALLMVLDPVPNDRDMDVVDDHFSLENSMMNAENKLTDGLGYLKNGMQWVAGTAATWLLPSSVMKRLKKDVTSNDQQVAANHTDVRLESFSDVSMKQLKEVVTSDDEQFAASLTDARYCRFLESLNVEEQQELVNAMFTETTPDFQPWERLSCLIEQFPNQFNSNSVVMEAFRKQLETIASNKPDQRHHVDSSTLLNIVKCIGQVPGLETFANENKDIIKCITYLKGTRSMSLTDYLTPRRHLNPSIIPQYQRFYATLDTIKDALTGKIIVGTIH